MVRNVMGSLLALAGAAAAVWSPFRAWYDGRHGSDIRVNDLFTGVGVTDHDAALLGSLFLPMGFAALLTLLGVLVRSRLVVALAGCPRPGCHGAVDGPAGTVLRFTHRGR